MEGPSATAGRTGPGQASAAGAPAASSEGRGPSIGGAEGETAAILDRAERAGLRFALAIRSAAVAILAVYSILGQGLPQGLVGAAFLVVFLVPGLWVIWQLQARRDRPWMRYAIFAFDAVGLGIAAVTMPMTTGGEVPQYFVFRVFGIDVFFFVLAMSALSLSPGLVLWVGGLLIATLWAVFGIIRAGMEDPLTWLDLPPSAPPEVFTALLLDPNFAPVGNRIIETVLLLGTALVTAAAVSRARRLLTRQIAAERARSAVSEVFGRFVPREVAQRITDGGGALTPEKREATILFVDIEGFTRFSETVAPDRLVAALDAWFDRLSIVVAEHRGVVVSLIGDAALVAFNAPLDNPSHAGDAIRAGEAILSLAARERFEGQTFRVRVGIATGPVAAGVVGGQGRRVYTLYGDTVNLAQRLEAMNKPQGTRLTVSETTWEAAGRPGSLEPLGAVTVRGREEPAPAYALRGETASRGSA